jgi:hypothetical protein
MPLTSFDPANKDSSISLSNQNLTATASLNAWRSVISTGTGKGAGRLYWRFQYIVAGGAFTGGAISTNTEPTNNLIGNDANGWMGYATPGNTGGIWHNNAPIGTLPLFQASGDYVVVAYDASNGGIYLTTMTAAGSLNTNWNSTNANPSLGSGGLAVSPGTALQPAASFVNLGTQATLDTTTIIASPTLSGFLPYDAVGGGQFPLLGVGGTLWAVAAWKAAEAMRRNPVVTRRFFRFATPNPTNLTFKGIRQ